MSLTKTELKYYQSFEGTSFDIDEKIKETVRRKTDADMDWLKSTFLDRFYGTSLTQNIIKTIT